MAKKPLDYFLLKAKSWHKVVELMYKYLKKYGNWEYIYEFDEGQIHVKIISHKGNVVKKRRRKK